MPEPETTPRNVAIHAVETICGDRVDAKEVAFNVLTALECAGYTINKQSAPCDVDGSPLDRRVYVMARGMARCLYPGISDEELEQPAKRWQGTALGDANCSVWQDHIPEARAALAALQTEGYAL